jgi:threonine dehydratase
MPQKYIKKILAARVYDVAIETPVDEAPLLSKRLNNRVLLKREDLQPVFSFKLRGAYNKIAQLSDAELSKGVVAASAGNHAQGVALAAANKHCKANIVMPKTTPPIKIDAARRLGAKVILQGDSFDEAAKYAQKLSAEQGMTFIHPYDDPDVIAGQGTVGMEILRQVTDKLNALFVPVGGGGLLAGVAAYVKYIRPDVKIVAVEPADAACLQVALQRGRRVRLPQVGLFADGAAVAKIGKEPFRILRQTVDQVITVNSDEICAAIKDIFDDTRSIAEPAGALAVAGLKKYVAQHQCHDNTLLAIDSGANIPERPGSFKKFCTSLGKHAITEFNYRYTGQSEAQIFVGLRITSEDSDHTALLAKLRKKGYPVVDLTDNEMAKLHIRYMVGGRAPATLTYETLYRVEFPERPGALAKFLSHLSKQGWNISLFHYRNHGAAYGRVLVGLQVPLERRQALADFFTELGCPFVEETDNIAYRLFL